MGPEGRYHLKRGFSKKGVDLLLYNPMSNDFEPKTIKYNGKFWEFGKEAIFFGLESIKNPATITEEQYNEAISKTPHWKGSRRPVLIATTELFYTFTPEFISFLSKAVKTRMVDVIPDIEGSDKKWKYTNQNTQPSKKALDAGLMHSLLELAKRGYGKVNVLAVSNIETVLKHIDGTTAWYIRESFDMGEDSGIQLMTRPKKPIIKPITIIIGAAVIIAIMLLIAVLQRGGIPNPFQR